MYLRMSLVTSSLMTPVGGTFKRGFGVVRSAIPIPKG